MLPTNDRRKWYREEYLRTNHWKDLRNQVIDKAPNGLCIACQKSRANDVHHIVYKKIFDVSWKQLLPLCRRCHTECHDLIKQKIITPGESRERKKQIILILKAVAISQNRAGSITEGEKAQAVTAFDKAMVRHKHRMKSAQAHEIKKYLVRWSQEHR